MPKLRFFYSVMGAGKSAHLLQTNHNFKTNNFKTLLLTSGLDDRDGMGKISSRIGLQIPAFPVSQEESIMDLYNKHKDEKIDAIFIDEIQFFSPTQIEELSDIVDYLHVDVFCYGLKNNFKGELFSDAVERLLAICDYSEEIKSICHCGKKANMVLRYDPVNMRIVRDGQIVEIGAEDRYASVCRYHWKLGEIAKT
ncbi:thymidine kinase [Ochrobactrum phage vB_OspM_OC]|nr:thymidine kinase [Ochrobactrum phage vB_OspM_OC]